MHLFVSSRSPVWSLLAVALLMAGCSSVSDMLSGDKVDYRTSSKATAGLDVPPDLTQLSRDSRYQLSNGTVSASAYQSAASAVVGASTTVNVAPQAIGNLRIERLGNDRWLSTTLTPDQIFPQIRTFWKDSGFALVNDRPETGVLETDWTENRAKLPKDMLRSVLGRFIDGAYSTGELDKYRTRVERTATGSDVYISHRGMVEVYIGERRESTTWQPRPADPQLEGEFLARLMVKLGQKDDVAKAAVEASAAPSGTVRARLVDGRPSPTLQVDDGFDRAWRRVGIALDRSGFTVEDRDRSQGVYFVRYVDPAFAGRDEPGLLSRMFSFGKKEETGLARYRVQVKSEGQVSMVSVLDSKGGPENTTTGKRIVSLLLEDLK